MKAVYLGETATALTYEVQCQTGAGALLQVDKPYKATSAARGALCLALPRAAGAPFSRPVRPQRPAPLSAQPGR